jgi:hypothetical protein
MTYKPTYLVLTRSGTYIKRGQAKSLNWRQNASSGVELLFKGEGAHECICPSSDSWSKLVHKGQDLGFYTYKEKCYRHRWYLKAELSSLGMDESHSIQRKQTR